MWPGRSRAYRQTLEYLTDGGAVKSEAGIREDVTRELCWDRLARERMVQHLCGVRCIMNDVVGRVESHLVVSH